MLRELAIHDLAVVLHLELSFQSNMTVLTGETGAGKSILIDALQLALGERADISLIRPQKDQASVSALFDIDHLPKVKEWLTEKELISEDNHCILRRTINKDGRSRAYINTHPVGINDLRDIGELLINIHGQHQHQSLLKTQHQRDILDHFGNLHELCKEVATGYQALEKLKREKTELINLQGQTDKLQFLQYQIQEFEELKLEPKEIEKLELEHRKLSHTEQWLTISEELLSDLTPNFQAESAFDVQSTIHRAIAKVVNLKNQFPDFSNCESLLQNALIQVEEAITEIQHFKDQLSLDPDRLRQVEDRLSAILNLARKHRIQPENIMEYSENLHNEIHKIQHIQESLLNLEKKLTLAEQHYIQRADLLSKKRKAEALQLSKLITESLQTLEMKTGHFCIEFQQKETPQYSAHGWDEIEFMVTTNPGHPPKPLRKIASGGELSRISLAIQVITAQKMTTPTLIFDEVDVGISGKTAEIVGKLLNTLGKRTQTLCVTHLPQVAAQGEHHFKVEKVQTKDSTTTKIYALDKKERINEIARLLGGIKITENTLAHAKEMLEG